MFARGVIAIDHGAKRTGFAVADGLRIAVVPLEPFAGGGSSDALLEHIAELLEERDVDTLLVGYPLRADGSKSARTLEVDRFVESLARRFPGIRVVRRDEHSTTREADLLLADEGYRGAERKRRRDSWSALVLLRDWIASGEPHA
jgi:putative holliday junction resolvase